jgi:hypothetical protein
MRSGTCHTTRLMDGITGMISPDPNDGPVPHLATPHSASWIATGPPNDAPA